MTIEQIFLLLLTQKILYIRVVLSKLLERGDNNANTATDISFLNIVNFPKTDYDNTYTPYKYINLTGHQS